MKTLKEFLSEALVSNKIDKSDNEEKAKNFFSALLTNTQRIAINNRSYKCPPLTNNYICYLRYSRVEDCFIIIKSAPRKPDVSYKLIGLDNIVGLEDFDPLDTRIEAGVNRNDYTLVISRERYWKKPNGLSPKLFIKAKAKGNTIEIQSCEKK